MRKILQEYVLGDMVARYETDEQAHVGLTLYPADWPLPEGMEKRAALDSMVQWKLAGDTYEGCYAPGNTMRNGESVKRMRLQEQKAEKDGKRTKIITVLCDDRGHEIRHMVSWETGAEYIRVQCEFRNHSGKEAMLEYLSSFSLEMISPYLDGDCHEGLMVHRLRSRWSQEGCLESIPVEALQLDTSWGLDSVRCERFGQVGSLPVNNFFPWLMVEDRKNHIFWGAQLSHGASWQMELFRKDENFAISGGLADREYGHWMKKIAPGEAFLSPEAVLTVYHADVPVHAIDAASARLVQAQVEAAEEKPEVEWNLPLVFNEYCTTWGCPSHENIVKILDAIRGKGFTYFVIDCGWYKEAGVPWDISMGDYQVSVDLFPGGLDKTVAAIKEAGLKPGIWFEFENVGPASKAFQNTEHLLKRDGYPLTTSRRRFWDLKDPWVREYLDERLIGMLKKYGFEYLKVDYNDTIGIGCDGCESPGEGLRQRIAETQDYFRKIAREIPGIIIENCASGGHRLEPGFMALSSMASFSDAHECEEIPIIAANLHRAILPRQSQIWSVIRATDSLRRIAYSVCATFLGRMCISGDVAGLTREQWAVLEQGIAFYRSIWPCIKDGRTYRYGPQVSCIRHPSGWQGIFRQGRDGSGYVVVHTFAGEVPEMVEMELPGQWKYEIGEIYSDTPARVVIEGNILKYWTEGEKKAAALRILAG